MHKDQDPYATPLKKAKGLGSAHEGAHHWMVQRIVSLALLPLIIWLVISVITLGSASYEEFTAWLSNPVNTTAAILFIIASMYHSILGNQEIIEDYIANEAFKKIKLVSQKLFFFTLGVISTLSIIKIALL